ncbi:MAG: hypothetical protein ISQ09_10795, partial [Rubripirellula sp.]|nr:hypothetical protein [Rubripirellula sp.]
MSFITGVKPLELAFDDKAVLRSPGNYMTMRSIPNLSLLLFSIGWFVLSNQLPAKANENKQNDHRKPNVVLILVDDIGLHDLSVEGST